MVISWLGGRFPSPVASCRIAVPLDARRIVTLTDMVPITVPCQEPVRVLSFSKAFFASDCAPADFGGLSWAKATVAVATSMIRIVSFLIGSPFRAERNWENARDKQYLAAVFSERSL